MNHFSESVHWKRQFELIRGNESNLPSRTLPLLLNLKSDMLLNHIHSKDNRKRGHSFIHSTQPSEQSALKSLQICSYQILLYCYTVYFLTSVKANFSVHQNMLIQQYSELSNGNHWHLLHLTHTHTHTLPVPACVSWAVLILLWVYSGFGSEPAQLFLLWDPNAAVYLKLKS